MDSNIIHLKNELLECRNRNEFAEVVLSNLLKLLNEEQQEYVIPFDDLVVTIKIAIKLLNSTT